MSDLSSSPLARPPLPLSGTPTEKDRIPLEQPDKLPDLADRQGEIRPLSSSVFAALVGDGHLAEIAKTVPNRISQDDLGSQSNPCTVAGAMALVLGAPFSSAKPI